MNEKYYIVIILIKEKFKKKYKNNMVCTKKTKQNIHWIRDISENKQKLYELNKRKTNKTKKRNI